MIQYTKGDLLESNAEALVNTVNTVGVMGKGIALQFKEKFPHNYILYRHACKEHKVKIGEMFTTVEQDLTGRKIIINFPTKTTWRRPSEYSYIEQGLVSLRKEIIKYNIKSIAIPPLGSHNGGLDWLRVKAMMEGALSNLNSQIYIYEPSNKIIERLKSERVKLTPASGMMLDVLCDMVAYGEFISVFATEKIVYFLQRLGAADIYKIDFIKYYYGPYSKGRISHALYHLNGSYIKGMGGMDVKPFDQIWLLKDTPKTINDYINESKNLKYKEISERTKKFLRGYYSTYSLELLATVDFIINKEPKLKDWRVMDLNDVIVIVNEDIKGWSKRKEDLFVGCAFLPKIIEHLKAIPQEGYEFV